MTSLRLLLVAEFISNIGWGVSQLALPMTVLIALDGGVEDVAVLLLLMGLATLIGKRLAEIVAATFSAKSMLITGNLTRAALFCVPALALQAGVFSIRVLWLVGAVSGTAGAFVRPSVRVYLSQHSGSDADLVRNTRSLTRVYTVSGLVGVAAGGALVSAVGATSALTINGTTYVVGSILVALSRGGSTCVRTPDSTALAQPRDHDPPREVSRALWVECTAALGLGVSSTAWTLHLTNALVLAPWLQGVLMAFGTGASLLGASFVRSDLHSQPYWRLAGSTHLVGAIFLLAIAVAVPGGAAVAIIAVQQVVVSALSTARDVSLAAGRLVATPVAARHAVEGKFYAYPLAAASLGRAISIPLASIATRDILAISTIPAIAAAVSAAVIAARSRARSKEDG
jgi:hypothetical protein